MPLIQPELFSGEFFWRIVCENTFDCSDDSFRIISKQDWICIYHDACMIDTIANRPTEVFFVVSDEYILFLGTVLQELTVIRPFTKDRVRFVYVVPV